MRPMRLLRSIITTTAQTEMIRMLRARVELAQVVYVRDEIAGDGYELMEYIRLDKSHENQLPGSGGVQRQTYR